MPHSHHKRTLKNLTGCINRHSHNTIKTIFTVCRVYVFRLNFVSQSCPKSFLSLFFKARLGLGFSWWYFLPMQAFQMLTRIPCLPSTTYLDISHHRCVPVCLPPCWFLVWPSFCSLVWITSELSHGSTCAPVLCWAKFCKYATCKFAPPHSWAILLGLLLLTPGLSQGSICAPGLCLATS